MAHNRSSVKDFNNIKSVEPSGKITKIDCSTFDFCSPLPQSTNNSRFKGCCEKRILKELNLELKGESNIHVIRFQTFIDFSTSGE